MCYNNDSHSFAIITFVCYFLMLHIVEQAGGQCLPCVVDVRYEDQVARAIEQAVEKFGGIDILVNNAGAINLAGTLNQSMKKYARYGETCTTVLYMHVNILGNTNAV